MDTEKPQAMLLQAIIAVSLHSVFLLLLLRIITVALFIKNIHSFFIQFSEEH